MAGGKVWPHFTLSRSSFFVLVAMFFFTAAGIPAADGGVNNPQPSTGCRLLPPPCRFL
jgi:hypothetical protein